MISMPEPSSRSNKTLDDMERIYKLRQDAERDEDAEAEEKAMTNLAA